MPRLPQVTARELIQFLKAQGFVDDRQAGSHLTSRRPAWDSVTMPVHTGTDVGRGLAARILKDADFRSTTTYGRGERRPCGNTRGAAASALASC